MSRPTSIRVCTGLASVLLLVSCSMESDDPSGAGAGGRAATGGATASGGTLPTAGTGGTGTGGATSGGAPSTGGGGTSGGAPSAGTGGNGGAPLAGTTSAGGDAGGGMTAAGGTTGGVSSGAGTGNAGAGMTSGGAGSDAGTGGAGASAGMTASGGAGASAGTAGTGGGMVVDQGGVPLAKPGDSKNGSRQYLNLGDMRLIANKWGSDELGCNTSLSVFVNDDKTFGWEFDRGACGGNKEKPDYPEIEFGIHPFGAGNALATTPSFSSTSLLPIQIKDIRSASVVLDGLNIEIQRASTYNLNFEFWLSQRNPLMDTANPGVHAELITFFGWQDGWACDKSGNVQAGDVGFGLCHQDDAWAGGKWRYFQFRRNGGSSNSFSGRVDVKALVDWLVSNANYSRDLWVTRLEVGSEIDDDTAGRVTLKNITFEVNGTSKSPQFGQ